jgi:hypothetical protein
MSPDSEFKKKIAKAEGMMQRYQKTLHSLAKRSSFK